MSETLLWLLYLLAGGIAFATIYFRDWPFTAAMVFGAAVAVAIWLAAVLLGGEDAEPAWFNVDLTMNATFSLIFAGAGAALGGFARTRRTSSDDATDE